MVHRPSFVAATGHRLALAQANCSVSAKGVLRGIHFADVPPGQAKYVTCVKGAVLDVIVDIRVGSPTFGQWTSVLLDDRDRRAVYLSEGLGHGFCSLQDGSTVVYLCSEGYNPGASTRCIRWTRRSGSTGRWSPSRALGQGRRRPDAGRGREAGLLPDYEACRAYRAGLSG